jgi:hypothetical protein
MQEDRDRYIEAGLTFPSYVRSSYSRLQSQIVDIAQCPPLHANASVQICTRQANVPVLSHPWLSCTLTSLCDILSLGEHFYENHGYPFYLVKLRI